MPGPKNFVPHQTIIPADWLNLVDTLVATTSGPPTSGSYNVGDFKKNDNMTLFGQAGAQYLITGWYCVTAGTPGVWMAVQIPVGPLNGSPTPLPPAPAPTPLYGYRIQAESMTGATLKSDIPGYDGTGFADWATTSGVTLSSTFPNVPTGTYTLNIRYYVYGTQQNNVTLNGVAISPEPQYPVQTPTAWATKTFTNISITAGNIPIVLTSDWGFTYYDYVELIQQASSAPPPPAPAPAPTPAPGPAPHYPFGARTDGPYPHGLTVTAVSQATMDNTIKTAYGNWKNNRLVAVPNYTPSTGIFAGQTLSGLYADKFSDGTSTVSEGIGYSLIILVLMAGYDTNAQTYFDGMFRFARAFPSYGGYLPTGQLAGPDVQNYLMDWKVQVAGTPPTGQTIPLSLGGGSNATDGDLDIALALFMAHRQWGSAASTTTTQVNYYQEALNVVAAMKKVNFASNGVMYVGGQYDMHRCSDTMPLNFHIFKGATNDTFWDSSLTNSATLVSGVITNYAGTTHMPPDWIWHPLTNAPQPSPGNRMEGPNEGNYASNALRCPWRWAQGFLFYGDTAYRDLANSLLNWFINSAPTSGNPSQTTWAYTLAGVGLTTPNYFDPTMNSGLIVGAMCGGSQFIEAPTFNTLTTSTSGGTLAANTYYYVITALNANGETLKSNERSVTTTGATSSNSLAWSAVTGATGYRVYRGTASGGENVYYAPGNVTSYTDTNAASTGGSPPTVNTTANAGWQTFLNTEWTTHAANLYSTYYNCELQLLALLAASGNWWKPF